MRDEERALGSVPWSVYLRYCGQLGPVVTVLLTLAMFAGQAAYLAADWWLALWSRSDDQEDAT